MSELESVIDTLLLAYSNIQKFNDIGLAAMDEDRSYRVFDKHGNEVSGIKYKYVEFIESCNLVIGHWHTDELRNSGKENATSLIFFDTNEHVIADMSCDVITGNSRPSIELFDNLLVIEGHVDKSKNRLHYLVNKNTRKIDNIIQANKMFERIETMFCDKHLLVFQIGYRKNSAKYKIYRDDLGLISLEEHLATLGDIVECGDLYKDFKYELTYFNKTLQAKDKVYLNNFGCLY